MKKKEPIDIRTLRYVLYARKSSVDESSQYRSIPDQIKECKKFATKIEIKIVAVKTEKQSAKIAGKRPVFRSILDDMGKKYDGILCWHPDRLSRNMLEGGQIIDMVDNDNIKDLQFVSHPFTNDANGKMLLGMLFVFSKQYSDSLSERVQRGVDGNWEDGKSAGTPKWGYVRNDDGLYEPDKNYEYVQEAWRRRLEGQSCAIINDYLREKNVHRITKTTKRKVKMYQSQSTIEGVFKDTFYFGKLQQAGESVFLPDIYSFQPMITEEEYNQVQSLGYLSTRKLDPKRERIFKPFVGMVYCGVCRSKKPMSAGRHLPRHKKYHVLGYTCKNKACARHPKMVRAKDILDSMYEILEKIKITDDVYNEYEKRISLYTEKKISKIRTELNSLNGAISHMRSEMEELSMGLVKIDKKSPAFAITEKKISELAIDCSDMEEKKESLKAKIKNPAKIKLTRSELLNLLKNLPDKMRAANVYQKDALCRKMMLNLVVDDKKGLSVIWKEPFETLFELSNPELVGVTGFEPATSRPPAARATAAPHPDYLIISPRWSSPSGVEMLISRPVSGR